MKKFIALFLALFLLAPCAFAEEAPAEDIPERTAADTFEFEVAEEDTYLENLIFDEEVTVTGENGKIMFCNCLFNAGIVNKGGEGTKVMLLPGCEFGEDAKCIISSGITEATLETDLPKFMLLSPEAPEFECVDAGAFVCFADVALTINGEEYPIENAQAFLNYSTGEFAEYAQQEANMQNICMWTENGEAQLMHIAMLVEEE